MRMRRRAATAADIPLDTGGLDPRCQRVSDLLDFTGDRRPPQVGPDAPIEQVVDALTHHPHSQRVYVVDPQGALLGTVSVRTLARHVFSHGHEPRVHPRRLLSALTSETAGHLMQKARVVVRGTDSVTTVVRDMIGHHSEEAAVVDEDGRLLGDLTVTDLLIFCRPVNNPTSAETGESEPSREAE